MDQWAGSFEHILVKDDEKFPRLKIAFENNYKRFVAHCYCQQVLRREWNGSVEAYRAKKSFGHRFAYFFIHLILSPFHALISFFLRVGRDLHFTIKFWMFKKDDEVHPGKEKLKNMDYHSPIFKFKIDIGWPSL